MGTEQDFDDIADINNFFDGKPTTPAQTIARPEIDRTKVIHEPAPESQVGGFTQKCQHCRGTGRFCSNVTGRELGPCFKCKGQGSINFKTSPEARAKGRAASLVKRANREAEKASWREQHKDLVDWLRQESERFLNAHAAGKSPTFDFTHKMFEAVVEFGSLTDAQLAAAQKCKTKSDERRAAWKAQEGRQDVAIDCSKIVGAFNTRRAMARAKGAVDVMKLAFHFPDFTFRPDRRDESVIWVNSTTHTNPNTGFPAAFGKIQNGKFSPFRICTPEVTAKIVAIAANPSGAARVTGQNWGICCCCGATLTNPESIEAGIGPICAENWGF